MKKNFNFTTKKNLGVQTSGIAITILLIVASVAFAQGRWENATNIGQNPTGDYMLTSCIYKTLGGFQFSIVVRGLCPFSVKVNPETGQVKK